MNLVNRRNKLPEPDAKVRMVTGIVKAIVKTLIWFRIFRLAFAFYGNPWCAWSALKSMATARRRVQNWTVRKYVQIGKKYHWNLYAPGWPGRTFDQYIRAELQRLDSNQGMTALQTVVFAITKKCSYQCEHCCEWPALNHEEALTADDLIGITRQLQLTGVSQIFFSGGEPLHRYHDLLNVVSFASKNSDVWILTSGQGLTGERASALRAAGMTGVLISVDHSDPTLHDKFRGIPGAYSLALEAARHARKAGLGVALSLCPTSAFISEDNLEKYALAARNFGAGFIQILEPKQVGRYAHQTVELSANEKHILEKFCDRLNTSDDYLTFPAVAYTEYANRKNGCHAVGDRHLYIDTDGTVHPCPFCRTPFGNALDEDMNVILNSMKFAGCPSHKKERELTHG